MWRERGEKLGGSVDFHVVSGSRRRGLTETPKLACVEVLK